MIIPPIGNKKTRRDQRTLCETGRLDGKTSTAGRCISICSKIPVVIARIVTWTRIRT